MNNDALLLAALVYGMVAVGLAVAAGQYVRRRIAARRYRRMIAERAAEAAEARAYYTLLDALAGRQALPASAWGTEAAKVDAAEARP